MLEGIAGQGVRALAIAPSKPGLIVAGTPSGVFKVFNPASGSVTVLP